MMEECKHTTAVACHHAPLHNSVTVLLYFANYPHTLNKPQIKIKCKH